MLDRQADACGRVGLHGVQIHTVGKATDHGHGNLHLFERVGELRGDAQRNQDEAVREAAIEAQHEVGDLVGV